MEIKKEYDERLNIKIFIKDFDESYTYEKLSANFSFRCPLKSSHSSARGCWEPWLKTMKLSWNKMLTKDNKNKKNFKLVFEYENFFELTLQYGDIGGLLSDFCWATCWKINNNTDGKWGLLNVVVELHP